MTAQRVLCRVAVLPGAGGGGAALVKIHGVFDTVEAARAAVHRLAADGGAGTDAERAFIVDEVGRWLPVADAAHLTVDEEEEIAAAENDNPEAGRAGSVCDVRRSSQPAKEQTAKKKDVTQQRAQLQDLLAAPLPAAGDDGGYAQARPAPRWTRAARIRAQHATLVAFARKLRRLVAEAEGHCAGHDTELARLDATHPDYVTRCQGHYTRALRESGLHADRVPFFRYFFDDGQSTGASQG